MALKPKNMAKILMAPVFAVVSGCSNIPSNNTQKAPEVPYNHQNDEMWIAAENTKNEQLANALKLQSWSAKIAKNTSANNLSGAKARTNGLMSDCEIVSKLVKEKKADQIWYIFMGANKIQDSMGDKSLYGRMQSMDVAIDEARENLDVAFKNCHRHIK